MGFDDGGGCGCSMAARGLRSSLDHRRGRSGGRRGGIGIVRGHHAREDRRDGCGGRLLGRRGLRWSRVGGCGAVRNEERPAVDPWSGILRVARFGITWRPEKISISSKRRPEGLSTVENAGTSVSTHPCSGLMCSANFHIVGTVPNRAPLL